MSAADVQQYSSEVVEGMCQNEKGYRECNKNYQVTVQTTTNNH